MLYDAIRLHSRSIKTKNIIKKAYFASFSVNDSTYPLVKPNLPHYVASWVMSERVTLNLSVCFVCKYFIVLFFVIDN